LSIFVICTRSGDGVQRKWTVLAIAVPGLHCHPKRVGYSRHRLEVSHALDRKAEIDPLVETFEVEFKPSMMSLVAQERALACHTETPSQRVSTIQARLSRRQDGAIAITYALEGQISRLCLPARSAPSRVHGLWQHTCFEAFISVEAAPEYYEFNFAPSGEWAAYAFQSYRESGPMLQASDPQITVRTSTDHFELDALICGEFLSALPMDARVLLGLSAVIEEDDGVVSYWALQHPPGAPDFHHASAFALELKPHVAAALDPAYTGNR
jgi:hypothetical protein